YELKLTPEPAPNAPRPRKPPTRPTPDAIRQTLVSLQKRGFNRLYQAARVFELSTPEELLDLDFTKPVYVLVDRLVLTPEIRSRLMDSIEICYREGRGEAILEFAPEPQAESPANPAAPRRMVFNERFECKTCAAVYQEPEPRLFSFNSPYGACPRCQGFGNTVDFDINLVIPDRGKSLNEGAIQPWTTPRYRVLLNELKKFARTKNIPTDVPFRNLT